MTPSSHPDAKVRTVITACCRMVIGTGVSEDQTAAIFRWVPPDLNLMKQSIVFLQFDNRIFRILWNQKFNCILHKKLPLAPLLSKMYFTQTFPPCLFNIILPSTVPVFFFFKLSCIKSLYACRTCMLHVPPVNLWSLHFARNLVGTRNKNCRW